MDTYRVDIHNVNERSKALDKIVALIQKDYDDLQKKINQNLEPIDRTYPKSDGKMSIMYLGQLIMFRENHKDSYFFSVMNNDKYLGGVFVFLDTLWDTDDEIIQTPSPGFEGIAKSVEGLKHDVKINSLLIPAIKEFVKEKGFNQVFVKPYPYQGSILKKHYGFRETGEYSRILCTDV